LSFPFFFVLAPAFTVTPSFTTTELANVGLGLLSFWSAPGAEGTAKE
jgi:hypothetical protein